MDVAKTMIVVVRKAPYGTIDAGEAIRHANGGLSFGVPTALLLAEDGVFVARRNQRGEEIGYGSLSRALEDYLARRGRGPDGREIAGQLVVHGTSLRERGLAAEDLIPGARVAEDGETARLLAQSDWTLIY